MFAHIVPEAVGKAAAELFDIKSYHCAEAVVAAYAQATGVPGETLIPLATPFGGGFGKTYEEACGVISGGLLAIGHCHGRKIPGESWNIPAEIGARYHREFIEAHRTSTCRELRERFGKETQMEECRKLVRQGAENLIRILQQEPDREE